MVIISIYLIATSIVASELAGFAPPVEALQELQRLIMDPWHLPGHTLSSFISLSCFGALPNFQDVDTNSLAVLFTQYESAKIQKITVFRACNNWVLLHLVSCILSGRICVVD